MHSGFLHMEGYRHLLTSYHRVASIKMLGQVWETFESLEPGELFLRIPVSLESMLWKFRFFTF